MRVRARCLVAGLLLLLGGCHRPYSFHQARVSARRDAHRRAWYQRQRRKAQRHFHHKPSTNAPPAKAQTPSL